MRFSLRVYRLLLKLYPASFRENYHAPLQQQFREELVEVRGPRALAGFWARTLWDFALSMPVQLAREAGQDSRHALRLWRQRPAHTFFAIAVLAIAIGANTGVFSVLNAVLLRSLPFTEPDRLAVLKNFGPPRAGFHDWRRQSAYLEDAATYDSFEVNLEGVHQAARRRLTETSWNFFSVLGGGGPALGRGFAPGEDTPGQTSVAVLSHSTWQQLFGADPRAIGSTIRVNGASLTVVGIAPAGFDYPDKTDLWAPTTFDYGRGHHVDDDRTVAGWHDLGVSLAGTPYQGSGRAWPYLRDVLRKVQQVPGVRAVSGTEALPLNIDAFMGGHYNVDESGPAPMSTVAFVAPGFFEVMGTPVIAGREFTFQDLETTERIAVVNEEFGRAHGEPATLVGRMVTAEGVPALRIVGVVRGMRYSGPAYDTSPQIFRVGRAPSALTIVARVDGRAQDRLGIVRDAVLSVDPKVPVFDVRTMDQRLDTTLARPQFYSTGLAFFGGLGLLLAIIGVYGVTSYSVLQGTREMGIRLALGTTPGRLRATMLRQSSLTIGLGALAGLSMAVAFGRYLQSLVRGADSAIVATSIAAVLVTALVAALATWFATRHIARLDVGDVLRAECAD